MIYKKNFLYIEWVVTYQCNYSCNYCFFKDNLAKNAFMYKNRGPRLPKNYIEKFLFSLARKIGIFSFADSFKNYNVEDWLKIFKSARKTRDILYLSFTGGEPLLVHKKLNLIILELKNIFKDLYIRIDTNGSIIPNFDDSIKRYISYNVSYHPSQVNRDSLLFNLKQLDKQGKVLMVNRVIFESELSNIIDEINFFEKEGYFLNVNPANFNIKHYSKESKNILKLIKSKLDFENSLEKKNIGKLCSYPMFGFQLLPSGYAWIPPCDNKKVINLIKNPYRIEELLKKDKIICPSECVCFHQYPFSTKEEYKNYNIMKEYVDRNIKHRKGHL
jgi:organic radical activating enzyme